MTSLGKRKEREDEVDQRPHGSTIFVSNLPFTATSTDIQTLFSDMAPVRSAFVVLEKSGVSKGVGYVSFATREDAQAAFEKIAAEGVSLLGRGLRVQWAEKKSKDKSEAVKNKKPKTGPTGPPQTRRPSDPLAIRTVVVSGLPESIDSKLLWKKVRKYDGAEKVEWPITTDSGDDPTTAHVLFNSPAAAQKAVDKLHAHVFKGNFLSVTLKKRLDGLAKLSVVKPHKQPITTGDRDPITPSRKSAITAPSHASRLIVRNIPFNASEQDLRAVFLPFGPIYSIHIPSAMKPATSEDSDNAANRTITTGFAFVWMLSKKDAERAIEGCKGTVMRAGMAGGLVSDKQKRKKQRREEKKRDLAGGGSPDKAEDEEMTDGKAAAEREIVVDWALSKDKWEEEKAKTLAVNEEPEMEASDEESDNSSQRAGSDDDQGTSGSGDEGNYEDPNGDDPDKPIKPQLPPPESGTTLFVRNVPFTATEDELRTLFRAFGPLRYARLTLDAATGRARGTGFICFWKKEDADKVIQQSELLRAETTTPDTQPPKNPFSLPSILTPDPSSTLAQDLVLHGRTLDVIRAVTRDEAGKLKEQGEKMRAKADKRNIYLLQEGVIMPNSTGADSLPPAEVDKRTRSYNARRQLLKTNPSLYVSKVRLSVRQIPLFVTERLLKRLAIHAVRAFENEVKGGVRTGLTEDELAEVVDEGEAGDEKETRGGRYKKQGTHRKAARNTAVKQAKIVRQQERVDPVAGKGRSRGYGFIEMYKHADALRVLRWANNNPDVTPLFEEWRKDELKNLIEMEKAKETKDEARLKRMRDEMESAARKTKGTLIVEFSIENVQVVQRRSALQKERGAPAAERPSLTSAQSSPKSTKMEEPPSKKRKLLEDTNDTKPDKLGARIGAVIGRKRRERKRKGAH